MGTTQLALSEEVGEQLFKQALNPPDYVTGPSREHAIHLYTDYLNKHREHIKGESTSPLEIIPYSIRLKALERFVCDPKFETFWRKATTFDVISLLAPMFMRYFGAPGSDEKTWAPSHPKITESERDDRLDKAAIYFTKFINIMASDASTRTCFTVAFGESLRAANIETQTFYNPGAFAQKMIESLESPNGCRRMKTHAKYPRNLKENRGVKAERVFFIHSVSSLVVNVLWKLNHAMATEILNTIRPDIGPFTESNVRKVANLGPAKDMEQELSKLIST